RYYFPTGKSKKIPYTDIEKICTDHEYGVNALGYKSWGVGGIIRPENNYILKEKGTTLCNGFSVENLDEINKILDSEGSII
ncbi:hypothetical protein PIROE2DRAFT_10613, partial [Piromyces sp. E2]